MINLDLSGAKNLEDVKWKPLPDGVYDFIIDDAEVKPSKDSSKAPSLKVVLKELSEGKVKIFDWMYLDMSVEYAAASLKDFLQKVYGQEISGEIELDPTDLVGKTVRAQVTVTDRTDKPGMKQNEIVEYLGEPF